MSDLKHNAQTQTMLLGKYNDIYKVATNDLQREYLAPIKGEILKSFPKNSSEADREVLDSIVKNMDALYAEMTNDDPFMFDSLVEAVKKGIKERAVVHLEKAGKVISSEEERALREVYNKIMNNAYFSADQKEELCAQVKANIMSVKSAYIANPNKSQLYISLELSTMVAAIESADSYAIEVATKSIGAAIAENRSAAGNIIKTIFRGNALDNSLKELYDDIAVKFARGVEYTKQISAYNTQLAKHARAYKRIETMGKEKYLNEYNNEYNSFKRVAGLKENAVAQSVSNSTLLSNLETLAGMFTLYRDRMTKDEIKAFASRIVIEEFNSKPKAVLDLIDEIKIIRDRNVVVDPAVIGLAPHASIEHDDDIIAMMADYIDDVEDGEEIDIADQITQERVKIRR